MKKIALGTLSFVIVTFLVQASSHFVINQDHYAAIHFMRPEPIMWLGIGTMLIQGLVLSHLFQSYQTGQDFLKRGWSFGILTGLVLISYIALVEPSKYLAPSINSWILVEGLAGLVQFSLFGIILGIINRNPIAQEISTNPR